MRKTIYEGTLLPDGFSDDDLRVVAADYEVMLVRVMATIADRFDPAYPFVNTKLDLLTGKDFANDDPIRGQGAVYGWIQGRALEALAGHCAWFARRGIAPDLVSHLKEMMRLVLNRVRQMRARNGGHLWFFMTPEGDPFRLNADGKPEPFAMTPHVPFGFSDVFSAKGMFAAARYLGDEDAAAEALAYVHRVDAAIWQGRFVSDQAPLDPTNVVLPEPGRHFHGPFMIALGTAALLVLQGQREGVAMGLRLIGRELEGYVNLNGRVPGFEEGDLWEAVDDADMPYRDGKGQVLSDPGHALECVGLALKFTAAARASGFLTVGQAEALDRVEAVMPLILRRNFENGFLGQGICKAFDLASRQPMNRDLPWWSLPETMRAAAFAQAIAQNGDDRAMCDHVLRACHNAFVRHFVRPDLHLMAYQTISEDGTPISVIPATADADPGYHTGLSIIDMLDLWEHRITG